MYTLFLIHFHLSTHRMSRCTCCHICHTSLKTSRRTFYPCLSCPSIICRQCIESIGEEWEDLGDQWECPRCRDCCPCKRCKGKDPNTRQISPKRKERDFDSPVPTKRRKLSPTRSIESSPETREELVDALQQKNEQCLSYIDRTQRLLEIIRAEQNRISSELAALASNNTQVIDNAVSVSMSC